MHSYMLCQIRHSLMCDNVMLCIEPTAICRAWLCLRAQPRCQTIGTMTCMCRHFVDDYVLWTLRLMSCCRGKHADTLAANLL